jgi:hypothetical protein
MFYEHISYIAIGDITYKCELNPEPPFLLSQESMGVKDLIFYVTRTTHPAYVCLNVYRQTRLPLCLSGFFLKTRL